MERKVSGTTLINLERSDGGEGSSPNEKNQGNSGKSVSQQSPGQLEFSFDALNHIILDGISNVLADADPICSARFIIRKDFRGCSQLRSKESQ